MLKTISKKASIAIAATGIATAGTFSTLYIAESLNNHNEKLDYYSQISLLLNEIPGIKEESKMNSDELKTFLQGKIDESGQSLHSVLIDHISDNVGQINDDIQNSDDNHEMLKGEFDRVIKELQGKLDIMESGSIGTFDLNYYEQMLNTYIGKTQFNDLTTRVGALDGDITKIYEVNTTIKTDVAKLIDTVGDNTKGLVKTYADLKTAITTVETDVAKIDSTTATLTDATDANKKALVLLENEIKEKLAEITTGITINGEAVESKFATMDRELAKITTDLAANGTSITKMNAEIKAIGISMQDVDRNFNEIRALIKEHKQIIDQFAADDAAFMTDYNAYVTTIENFKMQTNTQFTELGNDLIELNNRINTITVNITNNHNTIAAIESTIANMSAKSTEEILTLRKLISENSTIIQGNALTINAIEEELTHLRSSITDIEKIAKDNEVKIAKMDTDLTALTAKVAKILNTVDSLILRMTAAEQRLTLVEDRVTALENAAGSSANGEHLVAFSNPKMAFTATGRGHTNRIVLPGSFSDYAAISVTVLAWTNFGEAVSSFNLAYNPSWTTGTPHSTDIMYTMYTSRMGHVFFQHRPSTNSFWIQWMEGAGNYSIQHLALQKKF